MVSLTDMHFHSVNHELMINSNQPITLQNLLLISNY